MTKGSIGLNAGAIWNLLSDGQHWSFEALRAKSALTDADLWSAIGWLARENKIEIDNTSSHPIFCPGTNFYLTFMIFHCEGFHFLRNEIFKKTLTL